MLKNPLFETPVQTRKPIAQFSHKILVSHLGGKLSTVRIAFPFFNAQLFSCRRASANFVAITCKRCYTLQPAWETNFKLHLLVCGGNNGRPSSSSRSSPDSLLRSYTEEDFGRAVPLGATALGGGDIFQVADYYRSLNPASNLTLPAVLGMVAARLGAEMCEDCGLAVLARDRVRHGPNCISKHGKHSNVRIICTQLINVPHVSKQNKQ